MGGREYLNGRCLLTISEENATFPSFSRGDREGFPLAAGVVRLGDLFIFDADGVFFVFLLV